METDAVMSAAANQFQFILLHEERRSILLLSRSRPLISIHAPARGATKNNEIGTWWDLISIHAPARGATCHNWIDYTAAGRISIHAPARGATWQSL